MNYFATEDEIAQLIIDRFPFQDETERVTIVRQLLEWCDRPTLAKLEDLQADLDALRS